MLPPRRMPVRLLLATTVAGTALSGTAVAAPAPAVAPALAPVPVTGDHEMGWSTGLDGPAAAAAVPTPSVVSAPPPGVPGTDVSSHQGNVDWPTVYAQGGRFAWVKATEGTTYRNPYFPQQYNGSASVGMIHGAYHYALPDRSSGTVQADFLVDNGGRWTADGRTMPPLLDIEYNPYGADMCYGLTPDQMVAWVRAFVKQVRLRTGRQAVIFTTTGWWNRCTGSNAGFGTNPLFISRWNTSPLPLPPGWSTYKFWQHNQKGMFPGDQDVFHGTLTGLQRFARGS